LTTCGGTINPYLIVTRGYFPGLKGMDADVDYSFRSIIEVNFALNHTTTNTTTTKYEFMVQFSSKYGLTASELY
jgi:hypothetical protein